MKFLSQITADQMITEPSPYLVLENVLDAQLCRELIANYPPLELFTKGRNYPSNYKLYLRANEILTNDRIAKIWREFINDSLQPELVRSLLRSLRDCLLQEYPDFERDFAPLDRLKIGVRGQQDFDSCDLLIDSFLVLHTPVVGQPCIERGPHIKLFNTLFLSYLFLRPEQDDAQGADFQFYTQKPGTELLLDHRQTVDPTILNVAATIPYRQNSYLFFFNTARTIQGVTARNPSPLPYICHHFSAYLRKPLFNIRTKLNVRLSKTLGNFWQPVTKLFWKDTFKSR